MKLRQYLLISVLIASGIAEAQIVKSTVTGTVRDATDASIPNAKVSVRNVETNVLASTVTDSTGNYVVPFLNPGTYTVIVEAQGFKTAVQPAFNLDLATKVRVDIHMEVGQVSQRVEVSAATPLLETDTATVGQVLTGEKMTQLPLLGRNYQALSQLAPTAVAPVSNPTEVYQPGLSVGNYYQIAGQRGSYTAYTIDGINSNAQLFQSQSVIPSLDSIREFKVQIHNFPAEYGRGTVQFTSTTKNGTNVLHGSVYNYAQDDIFNANDFFSNRAGTPKAKFHQNQFGATVGGPIFIPKIYNGLNKTFFFFGYEGTRFDLGGTGFAQFPDAKWLTGDFSGLTNPDGTPAVIYDPATTRPDGSGGFIRDPFPGNMIPQSRFNPVSTALFPFIPAPNATPGTLPGADNFVGPAGTVSNVNYWIARVDHTFSNRDTVYGRYMQSVENLVAQSPIPLSGSQNQNHGYNAMLSAVHVFSPSTINEFRLGYNRGFYGALQEGSNGSIDYVNNVFHLKNVGGGPITYGLPFFQWAGGLSSIGGPVDSPFSPLTNTWQFSDNLVKNLGKHSLKAGFDIQPQRFSQYWGTFNRGDFNFSGQFTQLPGNPDSGSPFADFLLGISNTVQGLSGQATGSFHSVAQAYYVQDDWRASPNLTFNIGLRYEYYSPWTDDKGTGSIFQFGSPPGSCFGFDCPPGEVVPNKPGQSFYDANAKNFAPRIGFSFSPFADGKTVIRSAFGIFYSPTDMNDVVSSVFNPPNALNFSFFPNNPITDLTTTNLSNQFPTGTLTPGTPLVTNNWPLPPLSLYTVLKHFPDAVVQSWQLTVQRELTHNLVLEVGYLGSHGYHGQKRIDFNQARLDSPGQLTSITSRLPYPSLSPAMFVTQRSAFNLYDAGTLRLERRFESGFSLLCSYTYSKTIDDYGNLNDATGFWPQNAYDPKAEAGLSSFNAKHRFTAAYVYQIPIGRGERFGSAMHPVLDGIVGGWQISGITTFQTGNPLALVASGADFSNTGQFGFFLRPNQIAHVRYLDPRKNNLEWFDPSAFQDPAFGTFGDARRGAVSGPGINNWDIALGKIFSIKERANLQVRMEAFNAFNHTQFSYVNGTLGQPGSTGFVAGTGAPRNVQLTARLQF